MNIFDIVGSDDVGAFTALGGKAYGVKPFEFEQRTLDAFNELPLDPYCGEGRGSLSQGRHRFRRYDDFKMTYCEAADKWQVTRLPHRPFIQSPKFNKAVGGVPRHLPPLLITPEIELDSLFKAFGFDTSTEFHAKVHQIRVIASADIHGVGVVEGPHRDGQDWQIVAVFDRKNITGGQSQFLPTGGGSPFFVHTVMPGYAICNEDAKMWHNVSDIHCADGCDSGHRDIFIIATNRWSHRKYGDEFERASLIDGQSNWALDRPEESPEIAG